MSHPFMKSFSQLFFILFFVQLSFANGGVVISDKQNGTYLKLINSQINVTVQNQISTVITNQVFVNDLGSSKEIEYAFPMPINASVTQLRWRVDGGDWLVAVFINDNDPSDPSDPSGGGGINANLKNYLGDTPLYFKFNNEIDANSEIEVELTYVELLPYSFDEVAFNYPSDYSLIQSEIIVNSQSFNFELFSGRTIDNIEFLNNDGIVNNSGSNAILTINEYEAVSINDIIIKYKLASDELGVIPFSTILEDGANECDDFGNGFFGLVVEPESNTNTEVIQKNFMLIIDSSGSMRAGDKMNQAKEAAEFIVNNLNTGDKFNIIDFDDRIVPFRPNLVEYNISNVDAALSFIDNIVALGATNISDTLLTAINQFDFATEDKANIVVFFTDGGATQGETNTQNILNLVEDTVNQIETEIFLFTFGVGDDVTTDLLTLLAVENNGFVTFLADDEISDVISNFYLTIRNPVLLNPVISVTPTNSISNIFPDPLPNLYKGQQLIFTGRYDVPQDITLSLSGTAFNQQVEFIYDFNLSDQNNEEFAFLPKLWAKNKMESLLIDYFSLPEGSPEAEVISGIIEETSICYQVLSPFTTLGDDTPLSIEEFMSDKSNSLKFFPNPFTSETKAFVYLNQPSTIFIQIYSIDGKLVKTISIDGIFGKNLIEWNGLDNSDNDLGSGMYIYTITIGGKETYFGKLIKN